MSDLDDAAFYLHGKPRNSSGLTYNPQLPGVVVQLADGTTAVHLTAVLDGGLRFTATHEIGPAGELRIWQAKYDPTAAGQDFPATSPVLTYSPSWWRTVDGPLKNPPTQ